MEREFIISSICEDSEFLDVVRINGLLKYNLEKTNGKLRIPDMEIRRVARNDIGEIIGGVQGSSFLSSLEIEVLWVSESYRGKNIAEKLLAEIEQEAKTAGCQISHLTTYSFQAPQFYQKQGYTICGEIDGFPDNISLFILKKQLF
jgi:GNAT superfamily N-acetyltransferase